MNNTQLFADKFAIGLSLVCALHCLAMPVVFLAYPVAAMLPLNNEAFHFWMVVVVVPISGYALTLGCKKHRRSQVLATGGVGVLLLLLAVVCGEAILTGMGEKLLTVVGAAILVVAHYRNYRECKKSDNCGCAESERQGKV